VSWSRKGCIADFIRYETSAFSAREVFETAWPIFD